MQDPINILIVDDEPKNLTVLETVLDDPAYRLIRAESADQALLALVVEEFALLILDIRMPGMTGFELAQMIKERKKTARVPIIFLTAYYNEDQHVLEGYESGAVDYLHKPVNAAILRSKVSVFAELHRKSRECALANRALLAEVTERRRAEEQLRALTHRGVQMQEAERGSLVVDLHNNITQMLCAILARSQALANRLAGGEGSPRQDALKLREMLGTAAEEVERIARNLRPSVLEHLGLAAVLRATGTEFMERTGVSVKVTCAKSTARLPMNTEMALFRILQQALANVEQHAHAHEVTLSLTQPGDVIQMTIQDDGIGFDPDLFSAKQTGKGGLGLLGMRERATQVGGTLKLKSTSGVGTEIEVSIPRSAIGPANMNLNTITARKTEKKRIFVVDDVPSNSQLVKLFLEQTNEYEVLEENDSSVALRAALEFRPDLVVLDFAMPGIDGRELASQFEAHPELKAVPIVYLTAAITKADARAVHGRLGKFPILAKPLRLAELLDCIQLQLSRCSPAPPVEPGQATLKTETI